MPTDVRKLVVVGCSIILLGSVGTPTEEAPEHQARQAHVGLPKDVDGVKFMSIGN